MTRTKKASVLFLTLLMVSSFLLGVTGLAGKSLSAVALDNKKYATTSNGVLTYNASEFTVTEDYSAFVPAAMKDTQGGITLLDPSGAQLMRLDQNKKGLLVKSVQTGNAVEGDSFSFSSTMKGNFEMDFRIFSEKTVQVEGISQLEFKHLKDESGNELANTKYKAGIENDNVLPALDIRNVGITFRSKSDPTKAFTVYVRSAQNLYYNHQVNLSVGIEGEGWYSWYMGAKYPGYGLETGKDKASDFGSYTTLKGTTMSNASTVERETFSTTIKFDVENMCVYGVNKSVEADYYNGRFGSGGSYKEEDVLVRNLATNNNGSGVLAVEKRTEQLKTLSSADFVGGYTTSVTILDMTSNDTVLTKAVAQSGGGDVYTNAITEKVSDPYDRYAKMIIYSVNGQDLVKNDEWNVDYNLDQSIVEFNKAKGLSQVNVNNANGSYVTNVKYNEEAGSTKFTLNGNALQINTVTPYVRYHGTASKFSLPVYVSGTESQYVAKATKGSVTLGEVTVSPNAWSVLTFTANAAWNFDLNECKITVSKADGSTENGAVVNLGRMSYCHLDLSKKDGSTTNYQLNETQIRLTSTATNIAAEGNAYGLNAADYKLSDGTYVIGLGTDSEKYASKAGTENANFGSYYTSQSEGWSKYGTGANTYQKDPYSDVREIGLTIRSTTDPTKAFTIYLASSSQYRARTTTRVGVEGEAYVNGSGNKGLAYSTHASNHSAMAQEFEKGAVGGTMGQFGNTYPDKVNGVDGAGSYNSMNQMGSYIKFDPATMTVYSYAYSWTKIRDLRTQNQCVAASGWNIKGLKTLNASDFANGNFTMEVFVSQMNTEWNTGLANVYYLDGTTSVANSIGYDVLSAGYDRKCVINVYTGNNFSAGLPVDEQTAYQVNDAGYGVTYSYLMMDELNDVEVNKQVVLSSPKVVTLFGTTDFVGAVSYESEDGLDTGIINFADGKGTFFPKQVGNYLRKL